MQATKPPDPPRPAAGGSARRVAALVRKELLQILRDPSSILIAGILPLLLLFLFGYGVSLDLKNVAVCVVVETPTPEASSFAASFVHSRFFAMREVRDRRACEADLVAGRIKGIVALPAPYSARAARGESSPIEVLVDGSDPNTAGLVQNYALGLWRTWLSQEQVSNAGAAAAPVTLVPRFWYNPAHESAQFLLPGLVAVNMTLIGTLLTALVMAREWERGTMEALMSTPIGTIELLAGKLAPYFLLGMAAMALSVGSAVLVFDVPFRGSFMALSAISAVFLLCMLAFGLLVSTLARNQFVASQAALIVGFLPAIMLSGFLFEISSMPAPIRILTYIMPARYFVPSLQTLFLVGDIAAILVPNGLAMAAITIVLLIAVGRVTRLRLD
ncbi:MAG TPA: ABC transporter permease [Stellaceae bacterium]|nr:ABC transporter permease [Stellaceae bacterium]